VGTLVNTPVPIVRLIVMLVAAGTSVTPAPVDAVIAPIDSVPVMLKATVRTPPGRVSNPVPLLACGSKQPFIGTQGVAFSIWLLMSPVISWVRLMLLSGGTFRKLPVRKVANAVKTGSGGLFSVSTTGIAVPLVMTMAVHCEPKSPVEGTEETT